MTQPVEEPQQPSLALSVEDLELSTRATWALSNAGIRTIGELVQWSRDRFLRKKLAGKPALREIEAELARLGLALAPDPPRDLTLHVYPAGSFHDPILLVGNRDGLKALREAITAALSSGASRTEVMAGDGEGYDLFVARTDEDMTSLPTHYTEGFARDNRPPAQEKLDSLWSALYKM